ncbi:MAG: succinate dehydrogenase, cytochrome b556 subunit [Granulosicoccus sp.]
MISNDKRPLSPHIQHYKLPLTAWLSVSHRATGVANSMAVVLLVVLIASAAGTPDSYAFVSSIVDSWFGTLALFILTLTLYFHLCNGIRHLFWDAGYGFDPITANKSAYVSLAAAVALSIVTWLVAAGS